MKRVYFVRHGESESNVSRVLKGADSALTDRGRQQSQFLAKRFENIDVDIVIASTYLRTQQTAEIFAKTLQKKVINSDLFVECRHPSEEIGLHENTEQRKAINAARFKNIGVPGWRYSDEENFEDLKARAIEALKYLSNQPEENIVVITHGAILRTILSVMLHGNEVTAEEFSNIFHSFITSNTGITLVLWNTAHTPPRWQLLTWNDHAHLG